MQRTRDNIESGEAGTLEREETKEEISSGSPVEKAKNEFRTSLQKIFSEDKLVKRIMTPLNYFENGL